MWRRVARSDRGGTATPHLSHHQEHTVNTTQHQYRRATTVTITTILLAAIGALPAAARQDAGPAHLGTDYPYFKAVQRVGTQFVAGDNLTGDGVPAPAWVDER
jgi:hypothetical protein